MLLFLGTPRHSYHRSIIDGSGGFPTNMILASSVKGVTRDCKDGAVSISVTTTFTTTKTFLETGIKGSPLFLEVSFLPYGSF